ncbi:hypothetical protein [Halobacillus andaensis]|uniref:hypothetical protein n=2 Tax=Halobacillus TaxID=45667 RepID=UPI003D711AA6
MSQVLYFRKMDSKPIETGDYMDIIYWIFIISVVILTFWIIFRKLTKTSFVIIAVIALLYSLLLAFSFADRL